MYNAISKGMDLPIHKTLCIQLEPEKATNEKEKFWFWKRHNEKRAGGNGCIKAEKETGSGDLADTHPTAGTATRAAVYFWPGTGNRAEP